MMDALSIALPAAAVAAPTLAQQVAQRAGNTIPAYATAAQKLAIAELARFGLPGDADELQASTRVVRYMQAQLAAGEGAIDGHAGLAELTKDEVVHVLEAFESAVHAGFLAPTEPYLLWDGQDVQDELADLPGFANVGLDPREPLWSSFDTIDERKLTSLGQAASRVMKTRKGFDSGFFSSRADITGAEFALAELAAEMDNQGYLLTGKPEQKSLKGAFAAAGDAIAGFAKDRTVDAAKAVLGAAWDIVKESPIVVVGAGLLAWRMFR